MAGLLPKLLPLQSSLAPGRVTGNGKPVTTDSLMYCITTGQNLTAACKADALPTELCPHRGETYLSQDTRWSGSAGMLVTTGVTKVGTCPFSVEIHDRLSGHHERHREDVWMVHTHRV